MKFGRLTFLPTETGTWGAFPLQGLLGNCAGLLVHLGILFVKIFYFILATPHGDISATHSATVERAEWEDRPLKRSHPQELPGTPTNGNIPMILPLLLLTQQVAKFIIYDSLLDKLILESSIRKSNIPLKLWNRAQMNFSQLLRCRSTGQSWLISKGHWKLKHLISEASLLYYSPRVAGLLGESCPWRQRAVFTYKRCFAK